MTDFATLNGLTLARVTVADDKQTIDFATTDGREATGSESILSLTEGR